MSLWKIAWRSLQQRRLSSVLTCFSMALGVALVVTVLLVHGIVKDSFQRNASLGYHLVVGGKNGSKLDLVLSTVYHVTIAEQPMPYHYYKKFVDGEYAGYVELAVPICLGDNYQGYRVIGTTPQIFDFEYADGLKAEFDEGENFKSDKFFQAVIGAEVARKTGLGVGDTFQPTHNVVDDGQSHVHEEEFTIVGVLKPMGTPNDRVLFINMEGFYLLEGHTDGHGEASSQHDASNDDKADKNKAKKHDHAHDDHAHDDHAHGDHAHDDHAHGDHAHDDHAHGDHAHDDHAHDDHAHDDHAHDDHAHGDHAHDDHAHDDHAHDDHAHDDHAHDDHAHDDHAHGDHAHHGHDHGHAHHHEPIPDDQKKVTAILVLGGNPMELPGFSGDQSAMALFGLINKGDEAQAAQPVDTVQKLLVNIVQPTQLALLGLTVLTVIVAGIGVMVSIYNSMAGRRQEIAVMRALGARRGTVMTIVFLESMLISLIGGLGGVLLSHGLVAACSPLIVYYTGVPVAILQFEMVELLIIPTLLVLATIVGYLPAMTAYRTDVVKGLSAS